MITKDSAPQLGKRGWLQGVVEDGADLHSRRLGWLCSLRHQFNSSAYAYTRVKIRVEKVREERQHNVEACEDQYDGLDYRQIGL